ncbi:MAG: hypothetical protein M4D80_19175 [Myxococcota bacterium]|nr:hypothetical protein [Myxococcota bacterium]
MNKWLACALVALTSGCPDIKTDADETSADPVVEFDPSRSVVPFPNNLLINPATGKVNLPAGCNETASTKALREGVLNALDGFGTFETAMSVTLTKPIDMASVTTENIVLFKSTDPAAAAVPIVVIPGSSIRFANQTVNADGTRTCDSPNPIDSITIVPRVPLEQKTTYIVALRTGLKTTEGVDYVPSFTWSLVRQDTNPVTVDDAGNVISDRTPLDPSTPTGLASLQGINLLWNAHMPVLAFLAAKQINRDDVLLAWSFKTQTVQDALDKNVAGTPTTMLNDVAITGPADAVPVPISVAVALGIAQARTANTYPYEVCDTGAGAAPAELDNVQCFLKVSLGLAALRLPTCADAASCGPVFVAGTGSCASLFGCANILDVLVGRVRSPQFQSDRPNASAPSMPIPGPWADPVKPAKVKDQQLNAFIIVPNGTQPAAGFATVLFQHGLGQSNTNILAIGGHLARDPDGAGLGSGFASIAINAVAHGDRRIQISNSGACATPPLAASCFAGFLSPDLGATRDNIRQTVVDHHQVVASLKKCTGGAANCGTFIVNPAQIVYLGQSLGGIIGGITAATSTDIKTSVLNVPGVGWADIFENTQTLDIRCTLVDGLIDAGTLTGDKRDTKGTPTETDDTGLCIGQEWKTQPGYRQFAAIGRWVLDPADPANFVQRLVMSMGMDKFLIQEVVGDTVVPNLATANAAALTGRTAVPARRNTAAIPTPTDTITAPMPSSKYIKYATIPADAAPGNTYTHGSLLSPAGMAAQCSAGTPQFCDGVFATGQMVVDAITYLQLNK